MEAVVDAAVEWHRSDDDWQDKADVLEAAIDSLLELREKPINECFCGTELEAGICPNGHDPASLSENKSVFTPEQRQQLVDSFKKEGQP